MSLCYNSSTLQNALIINKSHTPQHCRNVSFLPGLGRSESDMADGEQKPVKSQ